MVSAKEVVAWFEKDAAARKRLAELLVTEPDVRLAIINAVIRDVATKHDIEELRKEMKQDIEKLRQEINELRVATKKDIEELRKEMISLNNATNQRIDELRKEIAELRVATKHDIEDLRKEVHSDFKWVIGVILTIWGATVIPILMKLVGFI